MRQLRELADGFRAELERIPELAWPFNPHEARHYHKAIRDAQRSIDGRTQPFRRQSIGWAEAVKCEVDGVAVQRMPARSIRRAPDLPGVLYASGEMATPPVVQCHRWRVQGMPARYVAFGARIGAQLGGP